MANCEVCGRDQHTPSGDVCYRLGYERLRSELEQARDGLHHAETRLQEMCARWTDAQRQIDSAKYMVEKARDCERAEAQLAQAKGVLEAMCGWFMPDDWTALMEATAAEFHRETGMIAPGKDVPAAFGMTDEQDARRRGEWSRFMDRKRDALKAQARAALASLAQAQDEETKP